MVQVKAVSDVGIFTKNKAKSRVFYTEKLGLAVRSDRPEGGYLALGATKDGKDASLDIWEPTEEGFGPEYEAAVDQIGTVTGIGFTTGDLQKTVDELAGKGVKVEAGFDEGSARIADPDGNVTFLMGSEEAKGPGIRTLEFVTVVCSDADRAHAFFTEALGMKAERWDEDFRSYRPGPGRTAIAPFVPRKEMYDDPADYEADMAHLGENTWIMFTADDVHGFAEELKDRGVRFKAEPEKQPWGGILAEIYDPDGNSYVVFQPE